MTATLNLAQLTGMDSSHLCSLPCGHQLRPAAAAAFQQLQRDAQAAGFELAIASSFRSFERQRLIWNGKASGQRPVHDDAGEPLALGQLTPQQQLYAMLRFSAMPGTSRHHWGTDVDVYDAAAVPAHYVVQLSPGEVAPGGIFDPLHEWLDERMARGESRGFYRPYNQDRGGVAPERWHLSYAPQALPCDGVLTRESLLHCWDTAPGAPLLLRAELELELEVLLQRFVEVAPGWCPR